MRGLKASAWALWLLMAPILAPAGLAAHERLPPPEAGQSARDFDPALALRYSQEAIGRNVGETAAFHDSLGRVVRLAGYRGKPLVLSLVYTSCSNTCPLITQTLEKAAREANSVLGKDAYNIVSIGFDTRVDTPDRMRMFGREQGIDLANWALLAGDPLTLEDLAGELGFLYFRTAAGFDHLTQTTVIDSEGVVYRQIYGDSFEGQALIEPLKQLLTDQRQNGSSNLEDLVKRVRLFCTVYDPNTGRYRFSYALFIEIGVGLTSMLAAASWLVHEWRRKPPAKENFDDAQS